MWKRLTVRKRWSVVWSAWAAYFAVAEYIAVRSHHRDAPLSAHARYLLAANDDSNAQRRLGQAVLISGMVWFVRHIYRRSPSAS